MSVFFQLVTEYCQSTCYEKQPTSKQQTYKNHGNPNCKIGLTIERTHSKSIHTAH